MAAESSEAPSGTAFQPYIPPEAEVPEFTFKAVFSGVIFGIIFGAVTVYLGLKAGLTVSAGNASLLLPAPGHAKFEVSLAVVCCTNAGPGGGVGV